MIDYLIPLALGGVIIGPISSEFACELCEQGITTITKAIGARVSN